MATARGYHARSVPAMIRSWRPIPVPLRQRLWRLRPTVTGDDGQRAPADAAAGLTSRELEVLTLLAEGASNKTIARQLGIRVEASRATVGLLREGGSIRRTVVGEMGFYRSARRGASIRIDEPTIIYVLFRNDMERMMHDDPVLAQAFHTFIIRTLAGRLEFANREVASLQMG